MTHDLIALVCPEHGVPLVRKAENQGTWYLCPHLCRFPVVREIPRFVSDDRYAASFGRQWKRFQKTQLDSWSGHPISAARLERCVGGQLGIVRGKKVLEAGCGAGRFTEILLNAGADVTACDLSQAVEANYLNHGHRNRLLLAQADISAMPFQPGSFDYVICLGVIQHTPSPEQTIQTLCEYVRPGGTLVVDHYSDAYAQSPASAAFRRLLLRFPIACRLPACGFVVRAFWPIHRLTDRYPRLWRLKQWSPVVDYSRTFPFLSSSQLKEWALLDTHDAHTDVYKHRRTPHQIESLIRSLGLEEIHVARAGNGVEARGRRAALPSS